MMIPAFPELPAFPTVRAVIPTVIPTIDTALDPTAHTARQSTSCPRSQSPTAGKPRRSP